MSCCIRNTAFTFSPMVFHMVLISAVISFCWMPHYWQLFLNLFADVTCFFTRWQRELETYKLKITTHTLNPNKQTQTFQASYVLQANMATVNEKQRALGNAKSASIWQNHLAYTEHFCVFAGKFNTSLYTVVHWVGFCLLSYYCGKFWSLLKFSYNTKSISARVCYDLKEAAGNQCILNMLIPQNRPNHTQKQNLTGKVENAQLLCLYAGDILWMRKNIYMITVV